MSAGLRLLTTAEVLAGPVDEVRALLDLAFEGDFGDDDWDHALGGTHAVVTLDGVVVAHGSVVERVLEVDGRPFRTGYLEAVGTLPAHEGRGHGTLAVAALTDVVRGDFQLGGLGTSSHHFYERLGWERWRGPTFVRTAGGLVRSEEEDDGVMVLRTGPSAGVDLTAPISCEARTGDDW